MLFEALVHRSDSDLICSKPPPPSFSCSDLGLIPVRVCPTGGGLSYMLQGCLWDLLELEDDEEGASPRGDWLDCSGA